MDEGRVKEIVASMTFSNGKQKDLTIDELAGFVRPKHEDALNEYMEKDWSKLEAPLKAKDFAAFEKVFHEAIASANAWHDQKDKPFIKWKLPDFPPPDLDFTPKR